MTFCQSQLTALKKSQIMFLSIAKGSTNDLFSFFIHNYLAFKSMSLLFSAITVLLFIISVSTSILTIFKMFVVLEKVIRLLDCVFARIS